MDGIEKFTKIQIPVSVINIQKEWIFSLSKWVLIVYEHSYGLVFAETLNLKYELIELDVMIGDLSNDNVINADDIIYLLNCIYFPSSYTINHYPDYNKDKKIDINDALQLLCYMYFPENYPIA